MGAAGVQQVAHGDRAAAVPGGGVAGGGRGGGDLVAAKAEAPGQQIEIDIRRKGSTTVEGLRPQAAAHLRRGERKVQVQQHRTGVGPGVGPIVGQVEETTTRPGGQRVAQGGLGVRQRGIRRHQGIGLSPEEHGRLEQRFAEHRPDAGDQAGRAVQRQELAGIDRQQRAAQAGGQGAGGLLFRAVVRPFQDDQ